MEDRNALQEADNETQAPAQEAAQEGEVMEDQIATVLNSAIDQAQVVLVPLATAGICAWISPFVKDSHFQAVMKFVNAVGGNVRNAKNDQGVN